MYANALLQYYCLCSNPSPLNLNQLDLRFVAFTPSRIRTLEPDILVPLLGTMSWNKLQSDSPADPPAAPNVRPREEAALVRANVKRLLDDYGGRPSAEWVVAAEGPSPARDDPPHASPSVVPEGFQWGSSGVPKVPVGFQ